MDASACAPKGCGKKQANKLWKIWADLTENWIIVPQKLGIGSEMSQKIIEKESRGEEMEDVDW